MAITVDQANLGTLLNVNNSPTFPITTNALVSSGMVLVAYFGWFNDSGTTIGTVTDNGPGLTWTRYANGQAPTTGCGTCLAVAVATSSVPSGTVVTATTTGSVNEDGRVGHLMSFAGVDTTTPVGVTSGPTPISTSTTWSTSSLSLSAGSALVSGIYQASAAATNSVTAPIFEDAEMADGPNTFGGATVHQIVGSAGSYTNNGTWTAAVATGVGSVELLAATGGGEVWPPADTPPAPPLRLTTSNRRN